MMVETMLESSQDFGMSNGALPQWKRELLQRRAARSRPPAPPAQPPPPPPPPPSADEDEELRYGPGIVKRLQSRYLSLALRDAPRRRASLLRRAASLEHMLDERAPPPPAPRHQHPRPPRPVSMAAPPATHAQRRESVKRARSVDALSRLDSREESRATLSSPPPPPLPPPIAARPPQAQTRLPRTPRRPTPLLRETERPPPDVVKSTLRKFESAPPRRTAPAARVSAVLRDLRGPRTSTPEPRESSDGPPLSPRTPSPLPREESILASTPTSQDESTQEGVGAKPVSRAALEGIARAGSSVRYAFEAPRAGSHLPPLAATNTVLVGRARRVGVIRPMPARTAEPTVELILEETREKTFEQGDRLASPQPAPSLPPSTESDLSPANRMERREPPPAALVEPIPRTPPDVRPPSPPRSEPPPAIVERSPSPPTKNKPKVEITKSTVINGHATSERSPEIKGVISRIGAAGIERAWSGSVEKKIVEVREGSPNAGAVPWARSTGECAGSTRRPRAPLPAATSVVFNFSNRKEVPDYIENDGIILRGSRRNRIKAGEPGVVVLRPDALVRADSDSECELDGGPPSPCAVRFINDNVLINGKSSMPGKPNRDRIAKLKLQFDDSLTRTFEYPSEISLCEEGTPTPQAPCPLTQPPAPIAQLAESPLMAPLAANTHIASASLSRYTPSKTSVGSTFQLGLASHHGDSDTNTTQGVARRAAEEGAEAEARACAADVPRSWSESRTHTTDLLF